MLIARFQLASDSASGWPALLPGDDSWPLVEETLCMLGLGPGDAFSISVPGGASRTGRVRVLMPVAQIGDLYAAAAASIDGGLTFAWWDGISGGIQHQMRVWLQPPRPLVWNSSGGGIVLVEAWDARGMARYRPPVEILHGPHMSGDGRYAVQVAAGSIPDDAHPLGTARNFVTAIANAAGVTIDFGAYGPPDEVMRRIDGFDTGWQDSPLLALDQCLAASGWIALYDFAQKSLIARPIGGDAALVGSWMAATGYGRIAIGGIASTTEGGVSGSALMDAWNASAAAAKHLGPAANGGQFNYGLRAPVGANQINPSDLAVLAAGASASTSRPLASAYAFGRATLRQSAIAPASDQNLAYPWPSAQDIADYASGVYSARSTVAFGASAWCGWPGLPAGSFRATACEFTIRRFRGELCPVTLVRADLDDWILGDRGLLNDDPARTLVGLGAVATALIPGGGCVVKVDFPQMRPFLARITGYRTIVEGEKYEYEWEEVEPNTPTISAAGRWASSVPLLRKWNIGRGARAENVAERGNLAAVRAWPGYLAANLPTGSVMAIDPVLVGDTPIPMFELAPTAFPDDNDPYPPAYCYVFSAPNPTRVACP